MVAVRRVRALKRLALRQCWRAYSWGIPPIGCWIPQAPWGIPIVAKERGQRETQAAFVTGLGVDVYHYPSPDPPLQDLLGQTGHFGQRSNV